MFSYMTNGDVAPIPSSELDFNTLDSMLVETKQQSPGLRSPPAGFRHSQDISLQSPPKGFQTPERTPNRLPQSRKTLSGSRSKILSGLSPLKSGEPVTPQPVRKRASRTLPRALEGVPRPQPSRPAPSRTPRSIDSDHIVHLDPPPRLLPQPSARFLRYTVRFCIISAQVFSIFVLGLFLWIVFTMIRESQDSACRLDQLDADTADLRATVDAIAGQIDSIKTLLPPEELIKSWESYGTINNWADYRLGARIDRENTMPPFDLASTVGLPGKLLQQVVQKLGGKSRWRYDPDSLLTDSHYCWPVGPRLDVPWGYDYRKVTIKFQYPVFLETIKIEAENVEAHVQLIADTPIFAGTTRSILKLSPKLQSSPVTGLIIGFQAETPTCAYNVQALGRTIKGEK